jgi:adenylate cyclase
LRLLYGPFETKRNIKLSDIFISYSREDRADAQRFADAFAAAGLSVWWDTDLQAGDSFDMRIEAAIKAAKAVVVLWSENSVSSRWVRAEATLGDRLRTLVPVRIRTCDLPIMFELTHTAELMDWAGSTEDTNWQSVLTAVNQLVARSKELKAPNVPLSQAPTAPSDKPTVLILPFVNMSRDPDQEYFSDGVSEDIITDLGKVAGLSVVSRRTAFSYKGKTLSTSAAQALNVSHILEGSVRKSGDRVRITAQLLDAASDAQIWAERFDRTLEDIFAIQDEISEAIIAALKVKLAPEEKRAIEQKGTTNAEAYELFVMARQFSRSGSERMQPIIERLCLRAVELDPDFATAWALMAFAQSEMHQRAASGPDSDGGLKAAKRAVEIEPLQAIGHAALAEALGRNNNMNMDAGKPHALKALELDPECYEANLFAGYIFLGQRNYLEAVRCFEKAAAIDPIAYRPTGMVTQAYKGLGDSENYMAAVRRSLARCEKLLVVEPDHAGALGFYVSALSMLGETERAHRWARRAVIFHPDNLRLLYNVACGFAEEGDVESALELLEHVVNGVTEGWVKWLEIDNSLDPIRDDPRFKEMMAKAKLRF